MSQILRKASIDGGGESFPREGPVRAEALKGANMWEPRSGISVAGRWSSRESRLRCARVLTETKEGLE